MKKGHFHPAFFGLNGPFVTEEEQGDFMTGVWTAKLEFDLATNQGRYLHDVSKNGINFKELLAEVVQNLEEGIKEHQGTPKADAYQEVISMITNGAREKEISELLIKTL